MRKELSYKKITKRLWLGIGVMIVLGLVGCGRESVAIVNGERIYLDEFNGLFQSRLALMKKNAALDAAQVVKLKKEFLDELIDEKIMLRRAADAGIRVSDADLQKKIDEIGRDYRGRAFPELFKDKEAYRNWREQLRRRLVLEKLIVAEVNAGIAVNDDEARVCFRNRPAQPEDSVRVSQIVLADRQAAAAVYKRLKNGEDFAALARQTSTGPEGARGGDLGSFARGVLPEQFDRVLFSLKPGEVSEVVETPYGYHIFKVTARIRNKMETFEAVREKIKAQIRREKEAAAYECWLIALRAKTSIVINRDVLENAGQRK